MSESASLYEQIHSGQWFTADPIREQALSVPKVAVLPFPEMHPVGLQQETGHTIGVAGPAAGPTVHMGSMPALRHFVGRQQELAWMRQCIGRERCRLFAVLGLPGVGKSALAAAFVQDICADGSQSRLGFQQISWQSLSQSPSCLAVVQGWLEQLQPGKCRTRSSNFDCLVSRLFPILNEQPCLLVLDGVEDDAFASPADADAFDQLFQLFYRRAHRSCLLLTSRTRLPSLTHLAERDKTFRCLQLEGLAKATIADLLAEYELDATAAELQQLWRQGAGNPLLIAQTAGLIHDLFDGDVAAFLQEKLSFLGDVGIHFKDCLNRLGQHEIRLLHILTDASTPLNRQELWQAIQPEVDRPTFLLALHTLQRRFLIRMEGESIDLAPLLCACFQQNRLPSPQLFSPINEKSMLVQR